MVWIIRDRTRTYTQASPFKDLFTTAPPPPKPPANTVGLDTLVKCIPACITKHRGDKVQWQQCERAKDLVPALFLSFMSGAQESLPRNKEGSWDPGGELDQENREGRKVFLGDSTQKSLKTWKGLRNSHRVFANPSYGEVEPVFLQYRLASSLALINRHSRSPVTTIVEP